MRKPWKRKGRGYFVTLASGKQEPLGKTLEEAYLQWERLKASSIDDPDPYVAAVVNAFIESLEQTRSKATHAWYGRYLLEFVKEHGTKTAGQLKRHHLTRWAESTFPGKAARAAAIRCVKTCFNWAAGEQIIQANAFSSVRTPKGGRRETTLAPGDAARVLEDVGTGRHRRPFRLFLIAMRLSGCRPLEVRTVTAAHFQPDLEAWVFQQHKTRASTGTTRVVHLHPCLLTLTRILSRARPAGPLFLNADGKPWTKGAICDRMRRLRKKLELPPGTVAYSLRHGYITDGIVNGVDTATMAALTGTSVEMISKHYGHLDQKREHLKRAAHRAIGSRDAREP